MANMTTELKEDVKQIRAEQVVIRKLLELLISDKAVARPVAAERGFLHAAEAAEIVGVSKGTWFNWRKRGIVSNGKLVGYNRRVWPTEEVHMLVRRIRSGDAEIRKEVVK